MATGFVIQWRAGEATEFLLEVVRSLVRSRRCVWTQQHVGIVPLDVWSSPCDAFGESFAAGPVPGGWRFCPRCGRPIETRRS